jgi:hypothetical protein
MTDNTHDTTPLPPNGRDADATETLFGDGARQDRPDVEWPGVAAEAPQPDRLRPRFGTILWGVILLVFAAFVVTNALVPLALDPGTWIIGALVAGGVVLVAAGIAAAVRRTD